jgi:aspartate-semialdehyde dehydrogenase
MDELAKQTANLLSGKPVEPVNFSRQIAFNVIPQIDVFLENGYTKEEMKMVWETKKILGDGNVLVNPTAVRVPVFFGHGEALHIETNAPISAEEVKDLLENSPGLVVCRNDEDFPTQIGDASGKDETFVGRIREDISHSNGINMWIVADNVRKGAATNSIQIAELLIKDHLS